MDFFFIWWLTLRCGSDKGQGFGRDKRPGYGNKLKSLGHNRQSQIVAGAACVVRSEVVAVAGKDRAVGKITEPAENWVGRDVIDHGEYCSRRQRTGASIEKGKRHPAVNGHAKAGSLRGFDGRAAQ